MIRGSRTEMSGRQWYRVFIYSLFCLSLPSLSLAYSQPPLNLAITTFMDGGAPAGLYYMNYSVINRGSLPVDGNGNEIPGGAKIVALGQAHQLVYLSSKKVMGANLSLDVILNVSAVTASGELPNPAPLPPGFSPVTTNTAGLGDLIIGPALVWNGGKLMGGPLFQRVEFQTSFPTAKYDENKSINPGSNLTLFNPYYSFVWLFGPKWETSWRFYYAYSGKNKDYILGDLQPGQAVHLNYAVSRAVLPKWRLGVAGYYLQQLTEDKINGVKQNNSKERVMAAGPGFVYLGQGMTAMFSYPMEFSVENRFKGSRATLQLIHKF